MERDLYPRQWGRGPVSMERKKLVAQGLLKKFAKPGNAPNTPNSAGLKTKVEMDESVDSATRRIKASNTPESSDDEITRHSSISVAGHDMETEELSTSESE
ncbi:unnamed protein product [Schistosoma turkestanicum]|nr:unnamed protein product [Schistosoma turkestanicum]CAH8565505.1 unnamed protein product [Schistosoma turkestanicum]